MLHQLQAMDLAVLDFFNGFAGRWHALDLFLGEQQDNFLISGILFMAGFCWFWFHPGSRRDRRRAIILVMVPAVFIALVLNRMIATALPFRTRPMYDQAIPFINPHLDAAIHYNMETWSSFPSDTATYLFVMVAAFWLMSRRAGIVSGLYAMAFLFATRVYLGVHYPGDILAGAVLGAATMVALDRWGGNALARRVLAFEAARPHWFYPIAFLCAYEVGTTFRDIREFQHGLLVKTQRALQADLHSSPLVLPLALLAVALVVVLLAAFWYWRRAAARPAEARRSLR
jgi:undecaprenyl-diphosphatase